MSGSRALVAANPLCFGRGPRRPERSSVERRSTIADDAKLFATTFAAGFLFVSILIA